MVPNDKEKTMADRPDEENYRGTPEDPRAMQPTLPTFAEPEVANPKDEDIPEVSEERKAEARDNLRKRFPKMRDEDFDEVSREKTKTSKFELFIQRLMERQRWSRGVCHQQIDMGGGNDIRDC